MQARWSSSMSAFRRQKGHQVEEARWSSQPPQNFENRSLRAEEALERQSWISCREVWGHWPTRHLGEHHQHQHQQASRPQWEHCDHLFGLS